MINTEKSKPHK